MNKSILSRLVSIVLLLVISSQMSGGQNGSKTDGLIDPISWKTIQKDDFTQLRRIGTIASPRPGTANNPFWSIGCEMLDRDYGVQFASYRPYLAELGAGYARIQSGWNKTEKEKGKYDFEWLDEAVDGLIAEGLTPWMCLCYGNNLYSDSGITLNSLIISTPEALEAWERYVETIVQRYKGKVTMYEIWNEPNYGRPKKSKEAVETMFRTYAELTFRTVRAIRKYDKEVGIAAGSLASYLEPDFPLDFISYLETKGLEKELNYITFHPYNSPYPEKRLEDIIALRDTLAKSAPWIKLLQGEVGAMSGPAPVRNVFANNEYGHGKWILRQMAMEFGLGLPCSIFTIADPWHPRDGFLPFGLMTSKKPYGKMFYKKPAYHGYQNMVSVVDKDMTTGPCLQVKTDTDKDLYCVSMMKNGAVCGVILWYGGETPSFSLTKQKVDVDVLGLDLKDPVYADLLSGKVYALNKSKKTSKGMKFKDLPLWDSPIVIMEQDSFLWDEWKADSSEQSKKGSTISISPDQLLK